MFEDPKKYPELVALQSRWKELWQEVSLVLFSLKEMHDERSDPGHWQVLPLLVEPEDEGVFYPSIVNICRGYVPELCAMVDKIPNLRAFALSVIQPGGELKTHTHDNPFASASICLSGGKGAMIEVGSATKCLVDGDISVFDYRIPHRVVNHGCSARVALIIAVDLA